MTIPIAKEGWAFILPSVIIAILGSRYHWMIGLPLWLVSLFLINFFKDPRRTSLETQAAILSPADGKIISVIPSDLQGFMVDYTKVSIFMNVFNVHVNRSPMDGKVISVNHYPGRFKPAYHDSASLGNERVEIMIHTHCGPILVRLVAGLVARRIKSYIWPDYPVKRGQRMSIIKFGSRVDVYLPPHTRIDISPGDKVIAGITRIATILDAQNPT